MISLFIDTSFSDVSIALIRDEKVLSLIHKDIPNEHSVYVTQYIDDVLKINELSTDDVDEIIVINGPGSVTGIRIGVTIAKMYAYLQKIRIVAITSLQARVIGLKNDYLLSLIDAKHDNYYIGLYDNNYNKILEQFSSKEEVQKLIDQYHPEVVDNKAKYYDIEAIVRYSKNLKSETPHNVNPIYLKLPEAMEKHD